MVDNYRRPRRESTTVYNPTTSTDNREFKSYRSGEPINPNYGGKKVMETNYPEGWRPKLPDKRGFKTSNTGSKLRKLVSDRSLEKKLGIVSTALIGGSFLFFTPNVTGNVIWNLPVGNTNSIGAILFAVGLFGMLFCTRKK